MNTTNLRKKNAPSTNSFSLEGKTERYLLAKSVLEGVSFPPAEKGPIEIKHAALYSESAKVYYIANGFHHKHGKIAYNALKDHAIETFGSKEISDVNAYYFIEENLIQVCESYIQSGKEITNV